MKGKTLASGDLSGFLDQGTAFQGELSFQDTLRIDGKFEGAIRDGRLLIVGESADVNAEIHVGSISVSGRLRGSVHARDRVELHATANCDCSLDTRVLVVEEGASFEGSCVMQAAGPAARELVPLAGSDKVKKFGTSD